MPGYVPDAEGCEIEWVDPTDNNEMMDEIVRLRSRIEELEQELKEVYEYLMDKNSEAIDYKAQLTTAREALELISDANATLLYETHKSALDACVGVATQALEILTPSESTTYCDEKGEK